MPVRTMYSQKPPEDEIITGPNYATAVFRENIRKIEPADETEEAQYIADVYELRVSCTRNIEDRFEKNKELWCVLAKEKDKEDTAKEIRQIRNQLLTETDSEMSLDRVLKATDADNVTEALAATIKGDMAKYRQALRDVPQQEGFPYNVTWPDAPKK